jgi:Tol biopolymer transport system component
VQGKLVWSSNRFGNHELLLVELPGLEVRRLTNHPNVDFFSRFSPDGKRISFVRSRREWVSFREEAAWDLYVMNADGSGERRLAEHAYQPTWISDGTALVFLRGSTLVRFDLASGREQVLYDGAAEPTQGSIGDASFRSDGLLGLTWQRRGRQRVGVVNVEQSKIVAMSDLHACQIAWAPDGKSFVWVQGRSGNGGNQIMSMRLEDQRAGILIDLPGEYSHEYFPRFSSDGRWLVWGAAAVGHEHDRADYEIFAWTIGAPRESARRLTFSAANDQWPDLYVQ